MYQPKFLSAIACCCLSVLAFAKICKSEETESATANQLTVDRIFSGSEFAAKSVSAKWLPENDLFETAYTTLEKSEDTDGGKDIVRHDAATGDRTIMVAATDLVPAGKSRPLSIDGYQWSSDLSRLLVFTNAQKVWRNKTRGDYWVLDRGSRQITQLGGAGEPESMMFAKFSPDGRKVAFVRERNLFVQDLFDLSIKAVSAGSSDHIISGTTDWVYEEEFGLRDGFRWSPDGQKIAFWQLDVSEIPEFTMINNTDSLYPKLQTFAYPKVGQRNAKVRIGVFYVRNASTRWLEFPPHEGESVEQGEYIPRMEWVDKTGELLIRQLNRLQNVERLYLFNFESGVVQLIHTERDEAWIDMHDEIFWNEDASSFLWPSDRGGWRQVYSQSVDGSEPDLMTPGEFDAIEILHADTKRFDFIASPDSATERYLYQGFLDGKPAKRVTPTNQVGTHTYDISPDGDYAIHTWSTAAMPPVIDLVSLPDHKQVRALEDNSELRETLEKLAMPDIEFFKVDIGETNLDAWALLPPKFDKSKNYPLLVYVYGEPAGSTVVNRWGGTRALWHWMMAQKGYVVMSFDNRGTKAPRGRKFRKSIYKKLGFNPHKIKRLLCDRYSNHATTSIRTALEFGVGAAEDRRVCKRSLSIRTSIIRPSPWLPSPINSITTRSIRNAIWDCRPAMLRDFVKGQRSILRKT